MDVPPLRFPGFSVEWERVKVSDLLDFFSTNSLSWDMLNYENGKILNLHYGLIHKDLPTIVNMKDANLPFINNDKIPKNYTICESGDVAFADASEDTNDVGKAIEFINIDRDIVCGLHTIHGRDKTDITVDGFKGYLFSSKAYHNQIRRIAQGTKIYSISSKNMDEIYLGIPSKREQEKIFALLYAIDRRIATQNKIIEDLKKLKSAIIETEILHNTEADIIQLSNICNEAKQIKEEKPTYERIITVRLHAKGVCRSTAENLELGATQYYIRNSGQLIYGKQNFHNGAIGLIPDTLDKGLTSKDIPSFDINSNICNPTYLLYQLQHPSFYEPVEAFTTGSGSKRLKEKDFLSLQIKLPSKDKQDKIAYSITKISDKIEFENQILTLFQKQCQYLLSQMFI
ncbi:restriction endonuclease subunit S [Bacteroidales bacterium]|uniref:Restriction endonuclease subunit S n=1 Tax=Lepagella muris TaxID=3032870 RepID=A0AC61RJY2_9BACT|nr:restriction endonuclease subunit S [Lepagella muris]TKC57772.1 restriction endonuclease subunit S [Bacteroidales bacterium]